LPSLRIASFTRYPSAMSESGHEWIELTSWDDLPERVWMCNAHPGEQRQQTVDLDTWLPEKLNRDRRAYEAAGFQVVAQGPIPVVPGKTYRLDIRW
jgi:hypothetical protein